MKGEAAGGARARHGPSGVCERRSCHDRVDDFARRNCSLDRVEEADEFLVSAALHAAADHLALQDV